MYFVVIDIEFDTAVRHIIILKALVCDPCSRLFPSQCCKFSIKIYYLSSFSTKLSFSLYQTTFY